MDCNSKLYMELSVLHDIIQKESNNLKFRLDNDESFEKSTEDLDNVTFGKLIYTITKGLTNKELLDMTDEEMTKRIQVLQISERE